MPSSNCPELKEETRASDRELIESALAGDQRGYERLAHRYQDRLFSSIRAAVGCPMIAEDIVQEAFVRAFLRLDTFKHQSRFYTWLFRIALNSQRTHFRKLMRSTNANSMTANSGEDWIQRRDSPADAVERGEARQQVRDALSRLQDPHRVILVLREFEGCDYETIGEILNIKMGTVRSRLARARARLREELIQYHEPDPTGSRPHPLSQSRPR